jgi:uncharacterized protein (DUF924 family)
MADRLAQEIIAFWQQAGSARWFAKDDAFDSEIAARYLNAHHAAARGEFSAWMADWQGCLALVLLLDQFPRNLFRNSAHAFATDPLARNVAAHTIENGLEKQAPSDLRLFFYLPFEHSELLADQDRCLDLCKALDAETGGNWTQWAELHRDIILRFGRFPHRNAALGRITTAEEQAFLDSGGFQG